ncbi:MAG: HAMP domain-containing histidine kinase [Firmicutes bacterium]|nr:HAMP domain-containing histidine kinase [Bacillota bacterium]
MATKLKNTNKKLLQCILIPLCALLFVGAIHFGIRGIFTLGQSGFSERILWGGGYVESGEVVSDIRYNFQTVMGRSYGQLTNNPDDYIKSIFSNDFKADLREGVWKQMTENLDEINEYGLDENFTFHVKLGDRIYKSDGYDQEINKIGASITVTADGTTTGGELIFNKDESLYAYMEHALENAKYCYREMDAELEGNIKPIQGDDIEIYIGYTRDYLKTRAEEFDNASQAFREQLFKTLICFAATLGSFIFLCIITGKKDEEGKTVIGGLDCWPTELFCIAIPCLLCLGAWILVEQINHTYAYYNGWGYYNYYWNSTGFNVQYAAVLGVCWAIATVGIALILCCVRKIKAHKFWATFLFWRVIAWFVNGFKDLYYGGSAMRKMILVILGVCLLSATVVGMPLTAGILIVLAAKMIKQYEAIRDGVDQIRSGNAGYQILIEGNSRGELQTLASDINDISNGLDLAVRKELKNQRMKSELISNVSHDLKTPMTSIISYIDLLKKEGLDSENAPQYLEILDEKSQRLKKLCEDLFEAAKASSGDMPVHMARVEMTSLVNQGLGEYQDRFNEKGFQVIFNSTKDKFYVMADGQLLWRVIENLFGNLLKYAMENTRIYLDLREEEDIDDNKFYVVLDVKNMSKYPLNIPADELMERFKRGDDSRTTEGSGLGLAIARDLATLQKGKFDLKIDGDLFKATVMFEKVE